MATKKQNTLNKTTLGNHHDSSRLAISISTSNALSPSNVLDGQIREVLTIHYELLGSSFMIDQLHR
jgi:hypothetical protein